LDATDDRRLVGEFLDRKDEGTFREIYRRHTPRLYLLAARLLGHASSGAEDAVQVTWIRASTRLATFRWESTLRTWLSAILVNHCHEIVRARAAEKMNSDGAHRGPPEIASPSARPADRVDLERAVRSLPDDYREVFLLHALEGLTHEEIGALLGIEPGTSKSQLHKARKFLRAALASKREPAPSERNGDA